MERDFVGYGRNIPQIRWPNDARIVVSVVVNYEEGAEYSLLDGDSHHETNGEVPSPVPTSQRDLFNESFFEYGSRVGVWRLLDLLEKYEVNSTFFCCALALERNLEVAKEIVAKGHEVCGHGYRWEEYHLMDRDSERRAIENTVDSLSGPPASGPSAGSLATAPASTPGNWWWMREGSSTTAVRLTTTSPISCR